MDTNADSQTTSDIPRMTSTAIIDPPDQSTADSIEADIAEGTRAYALKNYQDATEAFSKACEKLAGHYGDCHPALVDAHICYGKALVKNAIRLSAVLGDPQAENLTDPQLSVTEVAKTSGSSSRPCKSTNQKPGSSKPSNTPHIHFSGDSSADDSECEDDESEGDYEQGTASCTAEEELEAAFQVLELARLILEAQLAAGTTDSQQEEAEQAKVKNKLFQVFELLAEVHQEAESFSLALESYQRSLEIQNSLPVKERSPRSIANTHFTMALAHELETKDPNGTHKAIEHVTLAIEYIEAYLINLRAQKDSKAEATGATDHQTDDSGMSINKAKHTASDDSVEIEDCQVILDGLKDKLDELKTLPLPTPLDAKEQALHDYLQPLLSAADRATTVNDLSNLVKKRAKSQLTESSTSSARLATLPPSANPPGRNATDCSKRSIEDEDEGHSKRPKVDGSA